MRVDFCIIRIPLAGTVVLAAFVGFVFLLRPPDEL